MGRSQSLEGRNQSEVQFALETLTSDVKYVSVTANGLYH